MSDYQHPRHPVHASLPNELEHSSYEDAVCQHTTGVDTTAMDMIGSFVYRIRNSMHSRTPLLVTAGLVFVVGAVAGIMTFSDLPGWVGQTDNTIVAMAPSQERVFEILPGQPKTILMAAIGTSNFPSGRNIQSKPITLQGNVPAGTTLQNIPYNLGTARGNIYALSVNPPLGLSGVYTVNLQADGEQLETLSLYIDTPAPNAPEGYAMVKYDNVNGYLDQIAAGQQPLGFIKGFYVMIEYETISSALRVQKLQTMQTAITRARSMGYEAIPGLYYQMGQGAKNYGGGSLGNDDRFLAWMVPAEHQMRVDNYLIGLASMRAPGDPRIVVDFSTRIIAPLSHVSNPIASSYYRYPTLDNQLDQWAIAMTPFWQWADANNVHLISGPGGAEYAFMNLIIQRVPTTVIDTSFGMLRTSFAGNNAAAFSSAMSELASTRHVHALANTEIQPHMTGGAITAFLREEFRRNDIGSYTFVPAATDLPASLYAPPLDSSFPGPYYSLTSAYYAAHIPPLAPCPNCSGSGYIRVHASKFAGLLDKMEALTSTGADAIKGFHVIFNPGDAPTFSTVLSGAMVNAARARALGFEVIPGMVWNIGQNPPDYDNDGPVLWASSGSRLDDIVLNFDANQIADIDDVYHQWFDPAAWELRVNAVMTPALALQAPGDNRFIVDFENFFINPSQVGQIADPSHPHFHPELPEYKQKEGDENVILPFLEAYSPVIEWAKNNNITLWMQPGTLGNSPPMLLSMYTDVVMQTERYRLPNVWAANNTSLFTTEATRLESMQAAGAALGIGYAPGFWSEALRFRTEGMRDYLNTRNWNQFWIFYRNSVDSPESCLFTDPWFRETDPYVDAQDSCAP